MKSRQSTVLLALVCLLSAGAAAQQFKYVQFDVPNSANTTLFAINDRGVITGTYRENTVDQTRHAFILSNGKVKLVDDPAAPAGTTVPQAINNFNDLAGTIYASNDTNSAPVHGFLYRQGAFQLLDYPGAVWTRGYGLNDFGAVLGYYLDSNNVVHGFRYFNGAYSALDVPGAADTYGVSINDFGVQGLQYFGTEGHNHSVFLVAGKYKNVDVPGAVDTYLQKTNNFGAASYSWFDGTVFHGAVRTPRGRYFTVDFSGGTNSFADGLNDFGVIVGVVRYADGVNHGFVAFPSFDFDKD